MVKLEYEEIESQKTISRFGKINTYKGSFNMPVPGPGMRTILDCEALNENINHGLLPQVISPYASRRNSILYDVKRLLGISYDQNDSEEEVIAIYPKMLVIPDPEYEALSFHCKAREKFKEIAPIGKNFEPILETGLSNKHGKQVESVWNKIKNNYGYTRVKDWSTSILEGVESDVYLSPAPIIRSNVANSVSKAFEHAYDILDEAIHDAKFTMYGVHFLLHWNIFKENNIKSSIIRKQIYTELDNWRDPRSRHSGLFFSFKIFDNNNRLSDRNYGSIRRKILSHFITDVSQRVREAKGAVIAHNFGNWVIGSIDSGVDIATFRMSGETKIEVPLPIGNFNKKSPSGSSHTKRTVITLDSDKMPSITNFDTLTEGDVEDIKKLWNTEGTYPLPSCIESAVPYWNLDFHARQIYCIRTRCGTFMELGDEYRNAGIDVNGIPLSEALRNRFINNSDISQEMQDLCPSLGKTFFSTYDEKSQFFLSKNLVESYVNNDVDYKTVRFILINRVKNKLISKQDLINILGEVHLLITPLEKSNPDLFNEKKKRFDKIYHKIKKGA